MPTIMEKLTDDELKTDYHDAKTDADIIERLTPWTDPATKNPDQFD